jgi:hypothetical protein
MNDKIEQFWRDATAEDVAKVMKGENVEARFRDYEHRGWWSSVLNGWRDERDRSWLDKDGAGWNQCQVYDPPQWYIDRPDPGEGWRLLGKFPDEPKLNTDEFFDTFDKAWTLVGETGSNQYYGVWYRRRIEPVNSPEKLDSARSNIPNGWQYLSDDEPRLESDAFWSVGAKDWVIIDECRVEYANRDKWPAIRQVENWRCMMLMEGCFYRLPNGHGIKITKQGFELE